MMSRPKQIRGVIAALLLPRDADGRPAWEAFDRNARFLVRTQISGLCVNGATGEFAGATAEERRQAVIRARRIAGDSVLVVSGVGASRWAEVLTLAREAEDAGADVLLLPAPYFFRYEPGDLAEFYRRTVAEFRIPALIYNLPAFTGGLDSELAAKLIREVDGIAGVKDSSGDLSLLESLPVSAVRFVGNDNVLAEALARGLCDGAISGVAGVVPEMTLALWRSSGDADKSRFESIGARHQELLRRLDEFPAPWGLKLIAELRGLGPATFALPLAAERREQAEKFAAWFSIWWRNAEEELAAALAADLELKIA